MKDYILKTMKVTSFPRSQELSALGISEKVTADGELLQPQGGWGSRTYTVVVKDSNGGCSSLDTSLSQPGNGNKRSQPEQASKTLVRAKMSQPI